MESSVSQSSSSSVTPSSGKTPRWQIILVVVLFAVFIFYVYGFVQNVINQHKQAKLAAEKKALDEARPHLEVQTKIQDMLAHSTALPQCPLIYPLLDSHGKITALGSYLSYFSMKQASYLPKTVFSIGNAGEFYNEFDLFNTVSPKHQAYYTQLPYYFGNVKDFGEGKLLKTGSGYKIQIRFWGTKPGKKYTKVFKKGKLHLAISWMSACLQDYYGFKPNADQLVYRDKPIFLKDEDLKRGAELETFFRNGGWGLVTGWDKILAKNPDNPYLFDRWLSVLDSRGDKKHLVLIQELLQKNTDNTFSKLSYLVQCEKAGQYDAGINQGFQELSRDNNNPDWYDLTVQCLEDKGYYVEAIQLLSAWTKLHPDNQVSWIKLKDIYVRWAWVARGSGWANTVTDEGKRLMKERMASAVDAGQKAAQLAPGDGRVWAELLELGLGAQIKHETMYSYYKNMFKADPYQKAGYKAYLNYLMPKWYGTEEEMLDFSEKCDAYDPGLLGEAFEEVFQVYSDDDSISGEEERLQAIKAKMKNTKQLASFEKSEYGYLQLHPEDLNYWLNFIRWEDLVGHQEKVFAAAQKLSKTNLELKTLSATLFLDYVEQAEYNIAKPENQEAFERRPDIVKRSEQAYRVLSVLNPDDWQTLNNFAFYSYKHHDLATTRKTLKAIGNNWSSEVWPKEVFDMVVKLAANGKDGYWHGIYPCPNHCLQFDDGKWVHLKEPGHPDSDLWHQFFNEDGTFSAWTQAHIGQVIRKVNGHWDDQGICPVCHGKGWLESKS